MKYLKYYNEDEELNEGIKHWLSIFLILTQLGMVPMTLQNASAQEKIEFVQNLPADDLSMAKFITFLNKNNVTDDENEIEKLFNQFKEATGTNLIFDEVKDNLTYDGKFKVRPFYKSSFTSRQDKTYGNIDIEKVTPINYVNDFANIIQNETVLNKIISEYEKSVDVELAVITIPSLNGQEISDYTLKTFNRWGVGKRSSNTGALICMSVQDRKIWITVGYGLEGVLTDAQCTRYCTEIFVPFAKAGDYEGGINALVNKITEVIGKEEQIEVKKQRLETERIEFNRKVKDFFILLGEILLGLVAAGGILVLIRRRQKEIKKLKDDINNIVDRLNNMGAKLKRIEDSNISKNTEELKVLKQQIDELSSQEHKISKKSLVELEAKVTTLASVSNKYIRTYNYLSETLEFVKELESSVISKEEYPKDMKMLYSEIKNMLSEIPRTDLDLSEEYDFNISKLKGLNNQYSKFVKIYNDIDREGRMFGGVKENLLGGIAAAIAAITTIKEIGYNYEGSKPLEKHVSSLEDLFKSLQKYKKLNILKASDLYDEYLGQKRIIAGETRKILDYEQYVKDARDFVNNYDIKTLKSSLNKLSKDGDSDKRTINKILLKIEQLEPLLDSEKKDYIDIKIKIDEINGMIKNEYGRIEDEERRRRDEEERRRRRKREEEEEAARRRRNSYSSSSYGGGSYGGGGSSFGGFGGGSSGGGGGGASF